MTRFAAVLLLVPSLLAAQAPDTVVAEPSRRGIVAGVTAFTGGTWQPSGIELGVLHALAPARSISATVRLGSFVQDQAVVYGRTQGFFAAVLAGGRMPLAMLAAVGLEQDPSALRLIGAVEAGGELNVNSPLPQGGAMGIASAMLGLSFGAAHGAAVEQGFAILVGPALFFGKATTNHIQVSLRYQNAW